MSGDHDRDDQQHVDDGEEHVDLAGDRVGELLGGLRVGGTEPVRHPLDGGFAGGEVDALGEVDEQLTSTGREVWAR